MSKIDIVDIELNEIKIYPKDIYGIKKKHKSSIYVRDIVCQTFINIKKRTFKKKYALIYPTEICKPIICWTS